MTSEDVFFSAVASRRLIRPAVRAIVQSHLGFLVQRPTDSSDSHFAFIGGEYELGDSFENRIRSEFEEETNARVLKAEYRFVVENRFLWRGELVQTLEHYFEVELDRTEIESREPHLEQIWLPHKDFVRADVRPRIVRDILGKGDFQSIRHLKVEIT